MYRFTNFVVFCDLIKFCHFNKINFRLFFAQNGIFVCKYTQKKPNHSKHYGVIF